MDLIGFGQSERKIERRAVYSPGTGRKLGYFAMRENGQQSFQDADGQTVALVVRWHNKAGFFTDCHPAGGSFVPSEVYY